jgi:hypothetical protein
MTPSLPHLSNVEPGIEPNGYKPSPVYGSTALSLLDSKSSDFSS